MLAERRDYETYLRSGRRRDGCPDSGVALQLKFNPNHDPQDGRFTFANGGGALGGRNGAAAAARPEVHVKPNPGKAVFARRKDEVGIDGDVADKLNTLVKDPHASVDITLGSLPLTVRRTGADTVSLSGSVLFHSVEMDGHLDVVQGKQAIVISQLKPKAGLDSLPLGNHLTSLPKTIRIARRSDGRMVYSLDQPVVTKSDRFGTTKRHGAGVFYFKH